VDSLPWTVQLAAYGALDHALGFADRLQAQHIPALVTPIAPVGRGALWYRVVAGTYATRELAAAGREELWRRKLAPQGQGDLLRAPYSLALPAGASRDALRARGIPAMRWGADDRLLVGAFETADQATLSEARLKRARLHATLITRVGTRP
jgi:cell division protein FtsN